jgi:hypothetical protein
LQPEYKTFCLTLKNVESKTTFFRVRQVVKLEIHHMLAASPPGWSGGIGAPEFDFDDLLNEYERLNP